MGELNTLSGDAACVSVSTPSSRESQVFHRHRGVRHHASVTPPPGSWSEAGDFPKEPQGGRAQHRAGGGPQRRLSASETV